jgi:hypothetical protein
MKILVTTVLLLLLAVTPSSGDEGVVAAEERTGSENTSNILPISENHRSTEIDTNAPVASALDLSLFGIISLGVLGLFWIRRHTSEL